MKKQYIAAVISILLAAIAPSAFGAGAAPATATSGFYGGISLRDQGLQQSGMALGIPASALSRFNPIIDEETTSRSLLYGGYRFGNDVSLEASLNTSDPYGLRPSEGGPRRGLALAPASGSLGLMDMHARTWNLDLYTGWNFYRNFALYGRLGYAQNDAALSLAGPFTSASDPRRVRDNVNYGVGIRYDMTSSLGLCLEYARFGRFAGEIGSTPLDSDQVTFGLQFRF